MKIRLLILLAVVFIAGLSACKKNNDMPVITSMVGLNIINASADTVNIYLNGTRLNNGSNLLPGISTGYYSVPAGEQSYQFKSAFNTTGSTVKTLFSKTLPVDSSFYRSLFVTDETAAGAFTLDDVLLTDTLANTCLVRFVNASPDAGTLNVAFGDTTQFKSIPYRSASDFVLVGVSGVKPVKIFPANSTTPLLSTKVDLGAGVSYTFYSKGKLKGTGTAAFSLGMTTNTTLGN
ncbi:MAG TPA: DUF4397 domain-containing protein [Mucilaginibacter sp.]|jgi:hypothetical protein